MTNDRWLLPRRQTELPTWDLLPETTLHGRREATYLVLAATFLVAIAALLVLGTTRVVDVAAAISAIAPGVELPFVLLLPLGVVPFALTFLALAFVCELYGPRRASALVWVGLGASLALVGLMRVADVIDGGRAFGAALALAGCCLVAHVSYVVIFDAMRRRTRGRLFWLRLNVASVIAQGLGWSAFGAALFAYGAVDVDGAVALAWGAGTFAIATVLVSGIPAALAVRGFALFLRVGGHAAYAVEEDDEDDVLDEPERPALAQGSVARPLPKAQLVEDEDEPIELKPRAPRAPIAPYSSAEMRFFTEGDQLHEP